MTLLSPLHLVHSGLEELSRGLRLHGILTPADLHVVDLVAPRFGAREPELLLALSLAVRAPRVGHVGVNLCDIRARVAQELALRPEELKVQDPDGLPLWPELEDTAWQAAVMAAPIVGVPGQRDVPFVAQDLGPDGTLLMSQRMWREQERLAAALRLRAGLAPARVVAPGVVDAALARLFKGEEDGQGARAVRAAAERQLTVVTGGPGTGKTYSIKRLLALLLDATAGEAPLRIELAAPTGKAAVRMEVAMAEGLEGLNLSPEQADRLRNLEARTLHKLLGIRPDGSSRHGIDAPVPADVVVVDEASMVPLSMMRRLLESVPAGARLILLGDRDQLASVDVGTVLSDMVSGAFAIPPVPGPLAPAIVRFDVSRRFADAPTVAHVAAALQEASAPAIARAVGLMVGRDTVPDPIPDRIRALGEGAAGPARESVLSELAAPYLEPEGFAGLLGAMLAQHSPLSKSLQETSLHVRLLQALEGHRVLAVHRKGPFGVSGLLVALERRVQAHLQAAIRARLGLAPDAPVKLPRRHGQWLGRPILVTQNSYEVGLMNGDVGLVLPGPEGLVAVFPARSEGQLVARGVPLARLPAHSGALAMTVHKSQGSQFARVGLVLAGRTSAIQTRELVYTGITRTSSRLDWVGSEAELARALGREVDRVSGLAPLLWSAWAES